MKLCSYFVNVDIKIVDFLIVLSGAVSYDCCEAKSNRYLMFPLPARVQYNDYNQEELRIHVSNIVGGVGGVLGKYSCNRT